MLKTFGKDVIIYGFSSSIGKFVTLLLVPLFAKVFAPDEYGSIDIVSTIIVVFSIFGMMQLESAVSRYYYAEENDDERRSMVSTAFWSIIILSIFFLSIIFVLSDWLSILFFDNTTYATSILIGAFIIPVSNLNSLFTVIIRFRKKPMHYMFFQILQILITVGFTFFFLIYVKAGPSAVFLSQLFGYLVSTFFLLLYLKGELSFTYSFLKLKKMSRFSLPLVPAVAGGWLSSYANRFVMLGYLSLGEIGLYSLALKISSVFQLIGSAIKMAWGPFLWETFEKNLNHKEIFRKIQMEFSALALMLVIFMSLFSKEIIIILTNDLYLESTKLIGITSLALAISNVIMPLTGIGPSIIKRTEYNTLTYFVSVPVNVAALFLLVPLLGVLGVPLSLLLGNIVFLIVGWFNSERLYYIGFNVSNFIIYFLISSISIATVFFFNFPVVWRALFFLILITFVSIKYYLFFVKLIKKPVV